MVLGQVQPAGRWVESLPGVTVVRRRSAQRRIRDLVGGDGKLREVRGTEGGRERHVDCVAAAGHEQATNAGLVVAGVEGVPGVAHVHFEPRREVHREGLATTPMSPR